MKTSLSSNFNNFQTQTSFNGRKEVNKLALKYGDDLLEILNSKRFFWGNDVIKLTKKTVPNLKVKFNYFSHKDPICHSIWKHTPEFQLVRQEICLDKPFLGIHNNESRIKFLSLLVHEMTHALQNNDKQFSATKMLNDLIKTYPITGLCKALTAAGMIFHAIEDEVVVDFLLDKRLGYQEYRCFRKKEMSTLLSDMVPNIKRDFLCCKKNWDDKLQNMPLNEYNDCIMSLISLKAKQEADAYNNQILFYKKAFGINRKEGSWVVPSIYKIFADVFSLKNKK